jgi:hypothetical protein
VYIRIPTIGPTVVEFRMWLFVGACALSALEVDLGEIVILPATP